VAGDGAGVDCAADHTMVQAMKDSYEGEEGTPGWNKRKRAFLKQELLKGWEGGDLQEVAHKLTNEAKVAEYQENEQLYEQGGKAEFVFFILEGFIDLKHDGEFLFSPGEETSVGEYSLMDIGSTYYVTAVAVKRTVAALVRFSAFEKIAKEHPDLWKGLARKLAGRMNFPRDAAATRKHVVFLVHGIRTYSPWQPMVEAEFKQAGLTVYRTSFGFFDLIRFLVPLQRFRQKKINEVYGQLRTAMMAQPNALPPKLSILAHSFGSYIIAEILAERPDIEVYRLAFCGSIVPYDHRFIRQLGPRIKTKVVNDIGTRDFWPALANSVTTGYGNAGTQGFNRNEVKDRWFEGLGHSDFFQPAFCKKYWVPFFKHGRVEPDEKVTDPIEPPPCRLCAWFPFLRKGRIKPDAFGKYEASRPRSPPFLIGLISSAPYFKIKVWLPLAVLGTLLWWKGDYLAALLYRVCT
jgi:hypothetical protein